MIDDLVATFRVNDRQIYMALCSSIVWGLGGLILDPGLVKLTIDTGSRPSVVDG